MQAIQVGQVGPADAMTLATDVPVPALSEHDVLIRNEAIGVNFIDTYHRSGLYPMNQQPFTPGVEGAGVVAALGPAVPPDAGLAPGTRVAYITRPPGGSYAQYTAVHYGQAVPLPQGVDCETAAAAMIQGMTAMCLAGPGGAYPAQPGDRVLVTAAAGGTGRLVAQVAAAAGARVIGTASTAAKCGVARAAGCVEVINYSEQDVVSEVMRLTGGRGVRAVYDGVGAATFDASLACLDKLGWMLSYGNASGKVPPLDILRLSRHNVRLMRPALWDFVGTREELLYVARRTLSAVEAGTLRLEVTGRYPLAEAARAHSDLEARRTTGKLLLLPPRD